MQQKVKEFDYFIKVLRSALNGEKAPDKPVEVEWKSVFGLAINHSFLVIVYDALKDKLNQNADAEFLKYLEKKYNIECARHISQIKDFKKITDILTENKIPFLPLKGFLIKELYPKAEYRQMADMDIYVGKEGSALAIEALKSIGYTEKTDPDAVDVHDVMIKLPFANVELHREVEQGSEFTFSDCESRADNPYWYVMREEDFFMHMLRHAKKHYVNGGCGVRAILDLHLYRKKHLEFFNSKDFHIKFENYELYGFYEMLVDIADKWFGSSEDITELSEIEIYTITGGVYGTLENRVSKKIEKQSKFSYVMRALFPSVKTIKRKYKWVRKCIILLPLGYLCRIMSAIFNGRMKRNAKAVIKSNKNKDAEF